MDCVVHGVTKSWTWLSNFDFHFQWFVQFSPFFLPILLMLYGYRHTIAKFNAGNMSFTQLLSSGQFEKAWASVCLTLLAGSCRVRKVSLHGLYIPPVTGNLSVMNDSCGSPQRDFSGPHSQPLPFNSPFFALCLFIASVPQKWQYLFSGSYLFCWAWGILAVVTLWNWHKCWT